MKKIIFSCIAIMVISVSVFSQKNQILEDKFSVKLGLIGVWVAYENAFSDHFTLNSEIGYEGGFFGGSLHEDDFNYIGTMTISTEPRYYYNVDRRISKGKKTRNNAANFFSVELFYIPDWLTTSNTDYASIIETFSVVPKYGLNRSISEHLNFEFGFGVGYEWGESNYSGVAVVLDLRLSFDL